MINVDLVYLTMFREITGRGEERIRVEANSTLGGVLELLSKKYGQRFREALFDPKTNKVRGHNHITINGQLAHLLDQGFEIALKQGDRVIIAHAVSGG